MLDRTRDKRDDSIVLHKDKKRRKSDGVLFRNSVATSPVLDDKEQSSYYWRKLYTQLQRDRVAAVEAQLCTFLQESEEREERLKNLIRYLESDLSEAQKLKRETEKQMRELQTQLVQAETQLKVSQKRIHELSNEMEVKEVAHINADQKASRCLTHLSALLGHYQLLTGVQLTLLGNEAMECRVTNAQTKISTKFRLSPFASSSGSQTSSLIKFEPLENALQLPSFLHRPINFERADCPTLMQNILQVIFPDEDEK